MGNASGRSEGDFKEDGSDSMEFVAPPAHLRQNPRGSYGGSDPMVHSPPQSPRNFLQPPLMFSPQVPMVPFARPGETMHSHGFSLVNKVSEAREKMAAVMITWSHDGKRVAVTGSWDDWETSEPLQKSGKDFILLKILPSGVYHYRFIVDGQYRHAPEMPREHDEAGNAYNILDVQEYVPEATESLSEFLAPPSPEASYDNEEINEQDFAKPPPELPPQIQATLLNERCCEESLPRPQNSVLNHLYIQNSSRGRTIALGSTHRFLQKYVTVVLYQPTGR